MALEINKEPDVSETKKYKVTERLYVNADRDKIVPEDSPEAAFVYSTPGKEIPYSEAERLGLVKKRSKASDKKRSPARNKKA